MGANTGQPRVTMRHPDVANPLVCFDFQVKHHTSLGWTAEPDVSASATPASSPSTVGPSTKSKTPKSEPTTAETKES